MLCQLLVSFLVGIKGVEVVLEHFVELRDEGIFARCRSA